MTTRGVGRFALGDANFTLGASHRYAEIGWRSSVQRYFGPFGGLSYGKLTYLGEIDWLITEKTSLAATHLLSLNLKQGLEFLVSYDYYDPDIDLQNGYEWRVRLASAVFMTGYLEIMPAIDWNHIEAATTREFLVAEIQAHIWY